MAEIGTEFVVNIEDIKIGIEIIARTLLFLSESENFHLIFSD